MEENSRSKRTSNANLIVTGSAVEMKWEKTQYAEKKGREKER